MSAAAGSSKDDSTNVKVAVRCRPLNDREKSMEATVVLSMEGKTTTIMNPKKEGDKKTFIFDFCYFMDAEQRTVYMDLGQPILNKAFEGYNGTIFAYGQTGSGKSFSMMGYGDEPHMQGIIPQMNVAMFTRIREDLETSTNLQYFVTVSYLEIYNEAVADLLNPSGTELKIREHPKLGVYVENLAELVVKSDADIRRLIMQGNKVRQVAATNMNATSSRSHSIFTIKLEQRRQEEDAERAALRAKINLVDLAGSERADSTGAVGQRLKEGAAINKSLSALGNVINALADPQKTGGFIPYRDSKLTRILQDALGGNSITVMLAALSPADVNFDETLSTLNYANRAKNIKNNSRVNEDEQARMVRELREEVERLRRMVGTGGAVNEADVIKMQEMKSKMDALELAKRETWAEKERLSRMYEDERRKNLQKSGLTQWVMESLQSENSQSKEKLEELSHEKDQLIKDYRVHKDAMENARKDIERLMGDYKTVTTAEVKDEAAAKRLLLQIHEQKKVLTNSNQMLKDIKERLRTNQELTKKIKDDMRTQQLLLSENSEFRKAIQEDERRKLQQENEDLLAQERKRLMESIERDREEIIRAAERRAAQNQTVTQEDVVALQMELMREKSDKRFCLKHIDVLQKQVERLNDAAAAMEAQAQNELEAQEAHYLRVFRQYRAFFEEQRRQLDAKYAKQLQGAIADAVHLSKRNQELEEEKAELERAVADLRRRART